MFKFVLVINPLSVLLQVFYQMCKGMDAEELERLRLPKQWKSRTYLARTKLTVTTVCR